MNTTKPAICRTARYRFGGAAFAMAAALAIGVFASPAASAAGPSAPPTPTPVPTGARSQQEVAVLSEAATVYVEGEWQGYVGIPSSSGVDWSDPVKADFSCSGYIASSDGNVVTAGHCADPTEGKSMLVDAYLEELVQEGVITAATAEELVNEGAETQFPVEGQAAGSAPQLSLEVFGNIAVSGIQVSDGMKATVVENRPLDQGDVTLLKVNSTTPLPTMQLAPTGPNVGDTVDAIGYPGSVTKVVDPSLEPTFAQGQVGANQQTTNGSPFTEVSAAMSPGMSGGPVVNDEGQVIGIVSFGPSGESQQLNFAVGWQTLKSLLTRNGVTNQPSASDRAYRAGIDDYFAGKYREAVAALTTVLDAEPSNALAQEYKSKAYALRSKEPLPRKPAHHGGVPMWLWIVIGAAALAALAAGIALLARRGRGASGSTAGGPIPDPINRPAWDWPAPDQDVAARLNGWPPATEYGYGQYQPEPSAEHLGRHAMQPAGMRPANMQTDAIRQ